MRGRLAKACFRRFERLMARGSHEAALTWVERTHRLAPGELMPVEARGYLRLKLGQKLDGIADLKIVASQTWYEGSRRALERLAEVLRDDDMPDEADRLLRMHGLSARDTLDPAFA